MYIRLKEVLKENGIAQKALAERMGVTQQYISNLCGGRTNASIKQLEEVANIIGVPFVDLFQKPISESVNTTTPLTKDS